MDAARCRISTWLRARLVSSGVREEEDTLLLSSELIIVSCCANLEQNRWLLVTQGWFIYRIHCNSRIGNKFAVKFCSSSYFHHHRWSFKSRTQLPRARAWPSLSFLTYIQGRWYIFVLSAKTKEKIVVHLCILVKGKKRFEYSHPCRLRLKATSPILFVISFTVRLLKFACYSKYHSPTHLPSI